MGGASNWEYEIRIMKFHLLDLWDWDWGHFDGRGFDTLPSDLARWDLYH